MMKKQISEIYQEVGKNMEKAMDKILALPDSMIRKEDEKKFKPIRGSLMMQEEDMPASR